MPAANLLSLFDDIATLMDDVALMTKKASSKTIGLMGDDLAVNSEQMVGLTAKDELPVVLKIFWGGLLNKLILIPLVLLLTTFLPVVLQGFLVIGGVYLCYEAFEKVEQKIVSLFIKEKKITPNIKNSNVSVEERVKGAVKTDFILSAEILAIAASSMIGSELLPSVISLFVLAVLVNLVIYGSVLIIIKLDDLGLIVLSRNFSKFTNSIGKSLISISPYIMKSLGIIGTIAAFMVGGGIIQHTFHLYFGFNGMAENLVTGVILGLISFTAGYFFKKILNRA